jgi:hypothetical protein
VDAAGLVQWIPQADVLAFDINNGNPPLETMFKARKARVIGGASVLGKPVYKVDSCCLLIDDDEYYLWDCESFTTSPQSATLHYYNHYYEGYDVIVRTMGIAMIPTTPGQTMGEGSWVIRYENGPWSYSSRIFYTARATCITIGNEGSGLFWELWFSADQFIDNEGIEGPKTPQTGTTVYQSFVPFTEDQTIKGGCCAPNGCVSNPCQGGRRQWFATNASYHNIPFWLQA